MKTKTKTKQKILKVFAMCILFLGSSQLLLAQNSNTTQDVCEGSTAEPYFLQGTLPTSDFLWAITSGGTIMSGQGSASITIDWSTVLLVGAGPHILSVTETDVSGCIGPPQAVEITLIETPTADAGLLTVDDMCETGTYQLAATAGTGTISWTSTGDGTFNDPITLVNDPTLEDPVYTPGPNDISGNNTVVALIMTVSNGSCADAQDAIDLTIYDVPTADAGTDASICEGLPYTISGATASGYSTFIWTSNGTGIITGENTLTPTYTPSLGETGNITLTLALIGNAPCNDATNIMILTIDPTPATGPIWHN